MSVAMKRANGAWVAGQGALLIGACVAAVVASGAGAREPGGLGGCLVALAVGGALIAPSAGIGRVGPSVSVTTLGIVLLGPAPAVVIAVAGVLVWSLRARAPWPRVLDALVAHTTATLAGALAFSALGDLAQGWRTVVVVGVAYLACSAVNLTLVAWSFRARTRVRVAAQAVFLRLLPSELVTGLLTGGAVLAYQRYGIGAMISLTAAVWCLRLSAASAWRLARERDDFRAQVEKFRALHVGVIRVLVESMGMRDPSTARHSAAVARLARATATAAGLPAHDQALVHTAGLLHDIGKLTFPDRTLTGARLTEADWELIRSHPRRGADIIRQIDGFEAVAEVVLCSHERIDGRGYPRGLAGDRIPELARILAITECFHAMTAHDSYRPPLSYADAIVELRRVSGTQLDARLVEIHRHRGRLRDRPGRLRRPRGGSAGAAAGHAARRDGVTVSAGRGSWSGR